MKKYIIIFSLLVSITMLYGQAPQLINYQGKLDSSGVPITGTRNLTFSIYSDTASLTAPLWTETQNNVTIMNGIFNVLLGSATPFSGTLFTNPGERFIGVKVGTASEMKPRLKIASVAYSLRANQADGVADNTITSAKVVDGTIALADIAAGAVGTTQITDNAVNSAKILDGAVAVADIASNAITTVKIADNNVTAAKIADEPGVAHNFTFGSVSLTTTTIAVDSVTINIPTAGYVIVIAHGFFAINHTNGIKDFLRASISTTPNIIDYNNFALETYDAGLATASSIYRSFSLTKVEAVSVGSRKYYLNADAYTGSGLINRRHLTAQFFPTAYGTVISTKQDLTPPDDGISPTGIR